MSTNLNSLNDKFSKYLNKNLKFEKKKVSINNINSILENNKFFWGIV